MHSANLKARKHVCYQKYRIFDKLLESCSVETVKTMDGRFGEILLDTGNGPSQEVQMVNGDVMAAKVQTPRVPQSPRTVSVELSKEQADELEQKASDLVDEVCL